MIDFITTYWASILVVLVAIVIIIVLAVRGKKQIIYKMLYVLIDQAEKQFGDGTGKVKFSYVLEKVYAALPAVVKVFVTYGTLEKWIENALVEMKAYWKEQASIEEQEG